jgi:hypothetical protein
VQPFTAEERSGEYPLAFKLETDELYSPRDNHVKKVSLSEMSWRKPLIRFGRAKDCS